MMSIKCDNCGVKHTFKRKPKVVPIMTRTVSVRADYFLCRSLTLFFGDELPGYWKALDPDQIEYSDPYLSFYIDCPMCEEKIVLWTKPIESEGK